MGKGLFWSPVHAQSLEWYEVVSPGSILISSKIWKPFNASSQERGMFAFFFLFSANCSIIINETKRKAYAGHSIFGNYWCTIIGKSKLLGFLISKEWTCIYPFDYEDNKREEGLLSKTVRGVWGPVAVDSVFLFEIFSAHKLGLMVWWLDHALRQRTW